MYNETIILQIYKHMSKLQDVIFTADASGQRDTRATRLAKNHLTLFGDFPYFLARLQNVDATWQ